MQNNKIAVSSAFQHKLLCQGDWIHHLTLSFPWLRFCPQNYLTEGDPSLWWDLQWWSDFCADLALLSRKLFGFPRYEINWDVKICTQASNRTVEETEIKWIKRQTCASTFYLLHFSGKLALSSWKCNTRRSVNEING